MQKPLKTVNLMLFVNNINGDIEKDTRQLKAQPGKDIVILGSGMIVSALTQLDLIDEYRFIINPVIFGGGTFQFTGSAQA